MKGKKKKNALSNKQRQKRHTEKLKSFGIKKIGFKASDSEREFIRQAISLASCHSREEFILEAIIAYGTQFGLSMAEVNKELKSSERNRT